MTTLKSRAIYKYKETCGMKISYRTHPILQKLNDGKLGVIGLYPEDEYVVRDEYYRKELRDNFKTFLPKFSSNVQLLSNPFVDAMIKAKDRMIEDELWNNVNSESGTILNFLGFDLCYIIENTGKKHEETGLMFYREMFFLFQKNILVMYAWNHESKSSVWCSKRLEDVFMEVMPNSSKADRWNEAQIHYKTVLISMLNFIKYAPIEVKNLPSLGKTKEIICKYINETKSNIKILDSTWFTNLVKSDAFKVRGHLRLQPKKKDGQWTKELIWINEFQKEGYTRRAGKVIAGEDGEQWNMAAPPDHSGNWQQAND